MPKNAFKTDLLSQGFKFKTCKKAVKNALHSVYDCRRIVAPFDAVDQHITCQWDSNWFADDGLKNDVGWFLIEVMKFEHDRNIFIHNDSELLMTSARR
jgi:hypothetical protein